jgi:hypothetical protein
MALPKFDWTRYPRRRWMKEWMSLTTRATELSLHAQDIQDEVVAGNGGLDRKMQQEYVDITRELESITVKQETLVKRVLVSVPDDWWHMGKPDDVDIDSDEALDWLADGRYEELLSIVQSDPKA